MRRSILGHRGRFMAWGLGHMYSRVSSFYRALRARTVAVVGASTDPAKLSHSLLRTLIEGGYTGAIYPVNPHAEEILGLRCYPSLAAAPAEIELVVVIVPAVAVAQVIREAGAKGATAAVVISSGFGEAGRKDLDQDVLEAARASRVLVFGPNIQGLGFTPNRLSALFWPTLYRPGSMAMVGQSGSVSAAFAEMADADGLGVSALVNLGNQLDVSDTDALEALADEPSTASIAFYLEGFTNGRRFFDIAQRVALRKPLVVLKAGRTAAGSRAVASHTASLAGDDSVTSAALRQAGAIQAEDLESLYDHAKALALLQRPAGRRVLFLSTSGGTGALAADEAESRGLEVVTLPVEYEQAIKAAGVRPRSVGNPVDLSSFDPEPFGLAARLARELDVADIVHFCFGDPVRGSDRVLPQVANELDRPCLVTYMGGGQVQRCEAPLLNAAGVPTYPTPERAVRAIAGLVEREVWLRAATEDNPR